jgi:hypothetical protein
MALTDPPSGLHPGPGYDDTPAGNSWPQAAGPTTPGLLGRIARACYRHRWLRLQVLARLPAPARLPYRARWLPRYTRTTPSL